MKALFLVISIILGVLLAACAQQAQPAQSLAPPTAEILKSADGIVWSPGPASLPSGAQFVLLEGTNLSMAEQFTFRLKLPAGYQLRPHTHPAVEHVTVISGTLYFGTSNEFDKSKGVAYPESSFIVMPPGHVMFGWVEEETIIQVHSVGPWGIIYANPEDDPRKK